MVVEDEPDIYEVLLAMFEMWGIEGVAFVDGEEAIAWIDDVDNGRFRGELPELALLDIRLPGAVSGPAVGERLRKSPILGEIAIVLSTAYKLTVEEEAQVIERAGADKLMYKPLPKFNELQQHLETVIAARRAKAPQDEAGKRVEKAPKTHSIKKVVKPVSAKAKKTTSVKTTQKQKDQE
jgi:CheY-like chemotaxis protein